MNKPLTETQIDNRFAKRQALLAQIDALKAQVDAIDDEMKAECERLGVGRLYGNKARVRWDPIVKSAFNSAAFKKDHADLFAAYQKTQESRPFYFEKLSDKELAELRTARAINAATVAPVPVAV